MKTNTSCNHKSAEQLEAEQTQRLNEAMTQLIGGLKSGAYHRDLDIQAMQKKAHEESPELQRLDREIAQLKAVNAIFEK